MSLLVRFAVLTFLAFVALGLGLSQLLSGTIRDRALGDARRTAQVIAHAVIQPQLEPEDLTRGVSPETAEALGRAVAAGDRAVDEQRRIVRLLVWNRDREIVYADDPGLQGRQVVEGDASSHELTEALEGEVEAELLSVAEAREHGGDAHLGGELLARHGDLLEVYVPLWFTDGAEPQGVFELYLPYGPTAQRIAEDMRQMQLALFGGLVLLWALSFRIVVVASRRLQLQARELREQAAHNEFLAYHDGLTRLPNRARFVDRLQHTLVGAQRSGSSAAVLMLDLDGFADINDTLGHDTGDRLLRLVGPRLSASLREVDTVARLGGDEFAVLLPDLAGPDAAVEVAERLLEALQEPFPVGGLSLVVEACVGIAVYPEHATDGPALLQRADVALYRAKQTRGTYAVYEAEDDHNSLERLTLLGELRHAIESDELVLHYQPIADLPSGRITGMESLVRWQHPQRGLLLPEQFVPAAEQSGLVKLLTLWVLDHALRQVRAWRAHDPAFVISVNLSARNLLDVELPREVGELLARHRLTADVLELEITESTVMVDPGRALQILSRLAEMGVALAVDDYGTGYSSLAYLRRLPITSLKIDKSFVTTMATDPGNAVIVRSTVELARNLGLRVIAEGVETAGAWQALIDLGCDSAQGFYLSRALPADQAGRLLRDQLRAAAVT